MAAQNGRKCTFGQFKDHNLGMKHDKWPHFYLLFLLELFVIFVFIFENGQNSFSCVLSFGLSWSLKYLNFEQKLSIQTAYHIFLESTQPEVTKIHIMFLSSKGSQKKKRYKLMGRGAYIHYFNINLPHSLLSSLSQDYLNN